MILTVPTAESKHTFHFRKSFDLKYETIEIVTSKTVITITSSAVVSNKPHIRKILKILLEKK